MTTRKRASAPTPKFDRANGSWYFVIEGPECPGGVVHPRKTEPCPEQHRTQVKRRFPSKAAAKAELIRLQGQVQRGDLTSVRTDLTLREYLVGWLEGRAIAPSTKHNYGAALNAWVLPEIGDLALAKLRTDHLRRLYRDLSERGSKKKPGVGLSARSVRLVHRILHKAMEDAVEDGLLIKNPADRAAREVKVGAAKVDNWTSVEARQFLDAVRPTRLFTLWLVALTTGLRRGELAGLRWQDVNLDAGTITVRVQRTTAGYVVTEGPTKSKDGQRRIEIDAATVAVLRAHRARQKEERLAFGPDYVATDLVFVKEDGTAYHPQHLRQMFARECKRAGVRVIRLHDVRHTSATLLFEAGIHPKVVQERLGHSSIEITLDTYTHAIPSLQRDAAAKLAGLLQRQDKDEEEAS